MNAFYLCRRGAVSLLMGMVIATFSARFSSVAEAQEKSQLSTDAIHGIAAQILAQSDPDKRESLIAQHKSSAKELIIEWTKNLLPYQERA
ncbi:MAG: hypothetical protein ACKO9Q_18045, partial [Pirellula sp.]